MEAFSYDKHYPYLLDSSFMFLPNTNSTDHVSSSVANINNHDHNHNITNYMSCFLERSTDNNSHNSCFSPHDQHHPFYNQPDRTVDVLSSVNASSGSTTITTKLSICSNNSSSSALTDQLINPMDKRKNIFQQPQSKVKGKKQKKETVSIDCMNMKLEKKVNKKKSKRSDDKKKNYEESVQRNDHEAPSGYIYVRARRGQATDSHSLAERVRREKISQRMNLLQALVPGCHKVMGKANMLDEIISYVQSLQNQVEFLSLKIACVNPTLYDNGMNHLLDSLIFKPEVLNYQNQLQRNISRLEATEQPNVLQQQNHTHITNTNICNTPGYSHMDKSTLLQHQQAQVSNFMSLPQWRTLVSSPHTHVSPETDLEELC